MKQERPSSVVALAPLGLGLVLSGGLLVGAAGFAVLRITDEQAFAYPRDPDDDPNDDPAEESYEEPTEDEVAVAEWKRIDHTDEKLTVPEHVFEGVLTADGGFAHLHVVTLPPETVFVRTSLECSTHDADLGTTFSESAANAADWDITSDGPDGEEWVWSLRKDKPEMASGRYFVHVQGIDEDDDDAEIAYTLTIRHIGYRTDGTIAPGKPLNGHLTPPTGHRRTYNAKWPEGADAVRFDVLDAPQDVDVFVGFGMKILDLEDYEHAEESDYCTESLVVERADGDGEVLVVTVIDQLCQDLNVPFTLVMSADDAAPDELRAIRPFATASSPVERAAQAVVRLDDDEGHGSGVLITADGLVLSAEHVTGGVGADIVVSIMTDVHREPLESYRATVIRADADRDLALLQIDRLLDGSPLPTSVRFPTVPVRWDAEPRLGDPTFLCAYHDFGEDDTRDPISWTPGAVSGWQPTEFDPLLRVAAVVSSGASGGAVFDERHRLVGIIQLMFGAGDGDVGGEAAAGSVTRLPADWVELERAGR